MGNSEGKNRGAEIPISYLCSKMDNHRKRINALAVKKTALSLNESDILYLEKVAFEDLQDMIQIAPNPMKKDISNLIDYAVTTGDLL